MLDRELLDMSRYQDNSGTNANYYRMNEPFCRVEFDRAVSMSRNKSSPGIDGINYRMLKSLPDSYRNVLLDRMNYALVKSKMFKDWKEVQTIFIG